MFQALQRRRPFRLAAVLAAVLVFTLAATLLLPPASAHAQGRGGFIPPGHMKKAAFVFFIDLDDSHWAAPFVGPMHRLSVIRGYPDGRFQPNKPVSQVEALVMVLRALGYEDQLDPDARYRGLPRAASWAEPYVALADDIGLLDDLPGFNPMRPASRAWVAALLVAAAGVDEDAVEEALGVEFRDMDDIPAEVRMFVRLAAALGWFKGYPGNWFQP
ncbi:MAG TPA: S-layer homology domain-containing protein, partial [Bacillota bacterium]